MYFISIRLVLQLRHIKNGGEWYRIRGGDPEYGGHTPNKGNNKD